jgi:hypothetical protein
MLWIKFHFIFQLTWGELPNYQDVVIPKTELYFRSMLQERLDITVETHLWRRQIVVVKRFKFDFLTRDNIKYFKREANILKVLKHDNIVRFFGILIDPPSLGIVMQYGSKGDLFQALEKKRLALLVEKAAALDREVPKASSQRGSERSGASSSNKRVRSGSISIKSIYSTGEEVDGWNSGAVGSPEQSLHIDNNESDADRPSQMGNRSTVGWSDKGGRLFSSRLVNTLSSVAHKSHVNVTGPGTLDPLVCAIQVQLM